MRQRFFTSTAQTRLIKNILDNTYIPIYDTVQPGDYIIKGCKYIYNISLIRCIKSGILEGDGEFLTLDYSFYWGVPKLNHTEKLRDATGFYDSKVHEWLGRYLRAYRDMVGVNLMPFYNCFSGVYTSRFTLIPIDYINKYTNEGITSSVVGSKISVYESEQSYDEYSQGTEEFNAKYVEQSSYKILQIPIKLNRTYTIAVDCDSTVRVAPAFINHGHLVKVKLGTTELSLTDIIIDNKDEQGVISPISIEKTNTVFTKPFTIFINNKNQSIVNDIITKDDIGITYEQLLQRYEKYLYLLIQLPRDNTSSVVVLEGDYTNLSTEKIFSLESIEMKENNIFDEPEVYEASVEYSSVNTLTNISDAPYVAYFNVEGLKFDGDHLKSLILSIEPDDSYGYQEYNFSIKQLPEGIFNLQIFSYIPITEDTKFTIKYVNPILDDNDVLYSYPTESVLTNNELLDELLLSKLSLLQFNDEKNYPFADTLIEYLTLNVIDSAETISDNIKRTQDYFGGLNRIDSTYGAWTNYLRSIIYLDTRQDKKVTHLDNNGYVNRVVESHMTQPKNESDLPISTNYVYETEVLLKQQELRKGINKVSTVTQPAIVSKKDIVNDSLLTNPSSYTPVQKLIRTDDLDN